MAKYPSFAGGLSAGLEAGLNRQDTRKQQTNQAALKRFQMSQQMLEQGLNTIFKIKEAGGTVPPEMEQMVAQLAKQVDGLSEGLGMPDSGMYGQSTSALIGMPGPKKAFSVKRIRNKHTGEIKSVQESELPKYFPKGRPAMDTDASGEQMLPRDFPGEWELLDDTAPETPAPTDDRTDKIKNAEAYAAATGVSKAEAFKHLFPGEKLTDSRTTDQQDFEYYQSLPKDTPEQIEAANRFAKSANLDLTEDKGTELKQNLDYLNSLPEGQEKEIWRKKLGVADSDPAKIELFEAYQNLPADQQAAYDKFYKSDAKDSRTALMKNFEFLNSIKDLEQKAAFTALMQPDPSAPSVVREWANVSSWPKAEQERYLEYRKQIATMNAQQQMSLIQQIMAGSMGQNNTGTGDSLLNKVTNQPDAANSQTGPVVIKDDAEFDALPSGTVFIGPDGVERTKP